MTDRQHDSWDLAAGRILRRLTETNGIELVSSHGITALTSPLSALLARLQDEDNRTGVVADWLMEQHEVADLFASDEELEVILVQEWRRPPDLADVDDVEEDVEDLGGEDVEDLGGEENGDMMG